jgi:tRNA-Thr(GGU) m(6)t(6)A37 methyltransferase TsaA
MFIPKPIGFVSSPYNDSAAIPKGLGAKHTAEGVLEILPEFEPGLADIEGFSHLFVLWAFDRSDGFSLIASPPSDHRTHGVFATRSPRRPNPIGLTVVELLGRTGASLHVRGVDMLNGTPILDIKPYLSSIPAESLRRGWLAEAEAQKSRIRRLTRQFTQTTLRPQAECIAVPIPQPVWYICAMTIRGLAVCMLLLAISLATVSGYGQAANATGAKAAGAATPNAQPPTQTAATPPTTAAGAECNGGPCEEQQPRMIVTLPAPPPVTWPWHDRILWAAFLVLAILGYVGIMLALSTLKKIERQAAALKDAASAAQDTARAALLIAQSMIDSERPWIAIDVEPSRVGENSFNVFATNRGRSPAAIVQSLEHIQVAIDESHLAGVPDYRSEKLGAPPVPVMLLPGKSVVIKTFGRDDLKNVCKSEETLRRVQNWEEKLFICGKIIYRDLIAPPENQFHESTWCCWYIHGRQKSGMVMAGPPSYNLHT